MARVEEDAKKMNLANEFYSDMINRQRQEEMHRKGKEVGSRVDTSVLLPTVPVSTIPTQAKKTFVCQSSLSLPLSV